MTSSGHSRQQVLAAFVPRITLDLDTPGEPTHASVAGSLLSADISGFTSLSERHSAKGRVGAEQLAEIMSACFTDLIDAATLHGGDVLKFGGDALLILFNGDDHGRRAAAAGVAMQRALGTSSAARRAKLTMRVGIADGPFEMFVVGTQRRELLIIGRHTDRTMHLESSAAPGETLVDADVAAHLDPTSVIGDHDGGFVVDPDYSLPQTATPDTGLPSEQPADTAGTDHAAAILESFVPPPVVAQLEGFAQLGGEHRHATVAFLMVSGVGAAIERDPADTARQLSNIVDAVASSCDRLGVAPLETDISGDGFKFVLSAGAPVTRGNDSDALLRSVLEIIAHPTPFDLRIGVQRGRVFAGFIGHPNRWTYSMTGDCMSTAARMLTLAAPGDVIAVDDVLADVRFPLTSEPLEPAKVKGKSQPILAHRVLGRNGSAVFDSGMSAERSGAGDPAQLVGRSEPLAQAVDLLRGPSGRLEVVGVAGAGTTALLDAALHSLATERQLTDEGNTRTLRVSVTPDNRTEPYRALRPAMRRLLSLPPPASPGDTAALALTVSDNAPHLTELLPLLADVVGVDVDASNRASSIDDSFRRARTIDAVIELLIASNIAESLLLTVEDAHWLDESSAALLRALVASDQLQCQLAITSRPGDDPFSIDQANVIELVPLSDADVSRLAIDRSGRALSDDEIRAIVQRSAGNPLFAIELISSVASGSSDELPESIERLIATRIDALPPLARRTLRCAAVLGTEFDEATLQAAIGASEGQPVIDVLSTDLVDFVDHVRDDRWRFVQAVHRDVAYEGLPFRERRRLHAIAGERLEASVRGDVSDSVSALSVHWSRAGKLDRAWRFSIMAGDRAARMASPGEAIAAYQRALDAAARSRTVTARQRSRVATKLGDVAELAGRYDLAVSSYQRARRLLAHDDPDQVLLFRKRGIVHERAGVYAKAISWYKRGVDSIRELDHAADHEGLELDVALAGVRFRQGRYAAAIEAATPVADDIAAPPVIRLRACYVAHIALQYQGDRVRREHYGALGSEMAALVSEPVLEANLTNNLGIAAYYEGRWDAAAELYEESFGHREAAGDIIGSVTSLNNLGELRSDQHRFHEARELFQQALRRATAAGYEMAIHVVRANLGRLATREGRHDEAREILAAALVEFERMDAVGFALETRLRLYENSAPSEVDGADLARLVADIERDDGGSTVEAPVRRLIASSARARGDLAVARTEIHRALAVAHEARLDAEIANCLDELAAIEIAEGDAGTAAQRAAEIRSRLGIG